MAKRKPVTFDYILGLFKTSYPLPIGSKPGYSFDCPWGEASTDVGWVFPKMHIREARSGGCYVSCTDCANDCGIAGIKGRVKDLALGLDAPYPADVAAALREMPLTPTTITAAELGEKVFAPPVWVVDGLLPEGLAILAGKSKLGKSWMALSLALAIAQGGMFLGKRQTRHAEALYLALEDSESRLKERMTQLGAGYPVGLHLVTRWMRGHLGGEEALAEWLDEHPKVKLVIIDTLVMWKDPTIKDDYSANSTAMAVLKKMADERNLCVLVLTHTRKPPPAGADGVDKLDTVLGSTGLVGTADTIMILSRKRNETGAELFATGRDIREAELALTFDTHICSWAEVGEAEDNRGTEKQAALLNTLRKAGKPLFPSEILEAVGVGFDDNYIKVTLSRLLKLGKVFTDGTGKGWYTSTHKPVPSVPSVNSVLSVPCVPSISNNPNGEGTVPNSVPSAVPSQIALYDGVPGSGGTQGTVLHENTNLHENANLEAAASLDEDEEGEEL